MNSSISNSRALIAVFFVACASVFALLLGLSEWLVRAHAAPADTLVKHAALFKRAQTPYAAFGDSHVARGFDAQAPVVNLAYPSENIEKMAWKAARYLEQTPNPQTVLIQADPHLFSPYRAQAGLEDYPQLFAGGARRGLLALSDRYRPQLVALWRSFIKNGGRLRSTIETTPQGALLSPGNLAQWAPAEIDRFTMERVKLHRPAPGFSASPTANLYRTMIANFVENGAQVCLVALPTSPAYRDAIANLPDGEKLSWVEADAFFKNLSIQQGVRYLDHRDRYFDLNLFRDPDHLNKEGAVAYGPVLQEACFDDLSEQNRNTAIAQAAPL